MVCERSDLRLSTLCPTKQASCAAAMTEGWIRAAVEAIHSSPTQSVIYLSGGASQALGWLMSMPGASNTVLEVVVPYSRKSMIQLLGKTPTQFASLQTAEEMALSAYNRALKLSRAVASFHLFSLEGSTTMVWKKSGSCNIDIEPGCLPVLGVGFTGSLATTYSKHGDHRFSPLVKMPLPLFPLSDGSRHLSTLVHLLTYIFLLHFASAISNACKVPATIKSELYESEIASEYEMRINEDEELQQVIDGILYQNASTSDRMIILSGSFNPLHDGHLRLLEIASSICGNGFPCFEISAVNADKPPLSVVEIKRRIEQFRKEESVMATATVFENPVACNVSRIGGVFCMGWVSAGSSSHDGAGSSSSGRGSGIA
ncbi:hypothetical protein ZIOFF_068006 [Zingiber officinale]|uniref:Cytidyltransferase-like domain-containing protein n=1 Tax=Zingiber officinale TaxID=94328 RepID=A0A8J5C7M7_ZINOF|nr:hypothetical protein ZIOFF_068006 [Zingiber officinale]